MRVVVGVLVCFDDGYAGDEGQKRQEVERGVNALSGTLVGRSGCRLEDQDRLDEQEGSQGLEEGVRGDERAELVQEDGGPGGHKEEEGAKLREPGSYWEWEKGVSILGEGWDARDGLYVLEVRGFVWMEGYVGEKDGFEADDDDG